MKIDPITLEIIQNALGAIADELALVIMRSAYSNIVRDSMDYSTAVFDHKGRTIAQGLTTPVHLGSFPDAMQKLTTLYEDNFFPGDIFIFNDPYGSGGMHLPDSYIIKPVFIDNRLEGFVGTLAHQCDVGGIAPGGMGVFASEIYQEGLRIPTLKLYDAGEPNTAIFRMIEKNTREPVNVMGDIRAQIAACNNGEGALQKLIKVHGVDKFRHYMEELHDYAERLIRAEILLLPDGTFFFEDCLDGMGEDPETIWLRVSLTIAGDQVLIDWAGTSDQVKFAINGTFPTTNAMSYLAVRCALGGSIPNCEGYMRAITATAPVGSLVNPVEPAACGARGITCFRMFDALMGAFAQVLPERIPAANEGGSSAPHIAGRDHNNKPFMVSGGLMGAWGGSMARDGQEGISNPAANLGNTPIELMEARLPIEITKYSFVENSGGPGRHRGGAALQRGYRLLADEATLIMRSDRRKVTPYGLLNGLPGTPSWNIINSATKQKILPVCPMEGVQMVKHDEFVHIQAGAGGFGNPLERDVERVLQDIQNELITLAYAADVYGVVISDGTIDAKATEKKRQELKINETFKTSYLEHFYNAIDLKFT